MSQQSYVQLNVLGCGVRQCCWLNASGPPSFLIVLHFPATFEVRCSRVIGFAGDT